MTTKQTTRARVRRLQNKLAAAEKPVIRVDWHMIGEEREPDPPGTRVITWEDIEGISNGQPGKEAGRPH